MGFGCLSENFLYWYHSIPQIDWGKKKKNYSEKTLSSRFPVGLISSIPRQLHTGGYFLGSADVCEVVLGEKVGG